MRIFHLLYLYFRFLEKFGKSGGKLNPFPKHEWDRMMEFQPQVVFWCLGGNSITKDSSSGSAVAEVLNYVDKLREAGVRQV